LARVFREAGFEVLEIWTDYDGQYLMLTARPTRKFCPITPLELEAPDVVAAAIDTFLRQQFASVNYWKQQVHSWKDDRRKAVIWGSGSKGVAFLTNLNLNDAIEYVVDINPYRQGKFMAGTGQRIVAPEFLREYKPDIAIAMNPIYQGEIRQDLDRMGLATAILTVWRSTLP
jgi:hypothetical protein